ncbi:MAG: DUF4364 family protein [Defluviitaleaceae bacterium]|nr:DUF4364 family protein [Defluviitaleaceae bacterium]
MGIVIEYKDIENKLLLLYLVNLMDLPMSRSQIHDFVLSKDWMNNFVLEKTLADMVEGGFLEATNENAQDVSTTRYTLTEDGSMQLEILGDHLSRPVKQVIDRYVEDNRGKIRKGFEKTAHYFPNIENDEFIVKCGAYDDKRGSMLMEITVPVVTREQAKQIQANWNANYSSIYQRVFAALTEAPPDEWSE